MMRFLSGSRIMNELAFLGGALSLGSSEYPLPLMEDCSAWSLNLATGDG